MLPRRPEDRANTERQHDRPTTYECMGVVVHPFDFMHLERSLHTRYKVITQNILQGMTSYGLVRTRRWTPAGTLLAGLVSAAHAFDASY